jgi:magnesium transporter
MIQRPQLATTQELPRMTDKPELTELVESIRDQTPARAASRLAELAPDEVQFVLSRLPHEQAVRIAGQLDDGVARDAAGSVVISGDEQTVRELMTEPPAVVPSEYTVAEALAYLVKHVDLADIHYLFATEDGKLTGVVGMRDLLLASPSAVLRDITASEPFAFRTDTPVREAVTDALYYHYQVYPVVDANQRVVGIVQGWKLYERIASEVGAQVGSQYGVSKTEQASTSVWAAFRMRHPWLQLNLLTAFLAAVVVGSFEDTIAQVVALAAFLPVLAGQSGNTGCQALAITLRGMTLGELRDYPIRRLLRKEVLLGALNGALVGIPAAIAMYAYAASTDAAQPALLGVVIFVAMIGACIGSGIFGVVVPLTLKRVGADPATASSIFLTTFTDVIGMGLMLFLATLLVL